MGNREDILPDSKFHQLNPALAVVSGNLNTTQSQKAACAVKALVQGGCIQDGRVGYPLINANLPGPETPIFRGHILEGSVGG